MSLKRKINHALIAEDEDPLILCVDPGEHTGLALGYHHSLILSGHIKAKQKLTKAQKKAGFIQIPVDFQLQEEFDLLYEDLKQEGIFPDLLVVEDQAGQFFRQSIVLARYAQTAVSKAYDWGVHPERVYHDLKPSTWQSTHDVNLGEKRNHDTLNIYTLDLAENLCDDFDLPWPETEDEASAICMWYWVKDRIKKAREQQVAFQLLLKEGNKKA